jgi:DNA-binding CsgD family transcriptional regulator
MARTESGPGNAYEGGGPNTLLTPRQAQLVRLAASGMPAKEIARHLGISKPTVDGHFKAARERTGARNMAELISKTGMPNSGDLSQDSRIGSCSQNREFTDSSRFQYRRRGRPTVMTPDRLAAARELLLSHPATQVARKLGISRTTLYAYRDAIIAGK